MRRLLAAVLCVLPACRPVAAPQQVAPHSSSMAVTRDGATLYVVNADSDSVAVLDAKAQTLSQEIYLAPAPTADANGAYVPGVAPRALALSPDERTLYVSGFRSGQLYSIDTASRAVIQHVAVGSEPVGVVVGADGAVFVACSQDDQVVRVDPHTFATQAVAVARKPWALAWSNRGDALYVSHFLSGEISVINPTSVALQSTWTVPDVAPRGDPRLAHGLVRGVYDLAVRPGSDELWTVHTLLGTDTPQPALNFESTAFAALGIVSRQGTYQTTLSIDASDIPGVNGALGDVVSGPHAAAFTQDGNFLLLVDSQSADIMVVDAHGRVENSLLRPLPGTMPEGIVLSPDETHAYIDERNSSDVAVLQAQRSGQQVNLQLQGVIPRTQQDPMPPQLRLGQRLFYSANSDVLPITTNHWIACATCHMEGRSDAVTWLFAQGPRDTPSNAGGMLNTGFLFRTADRRAVQDYWHTINVEQGGNFSPTDADQVPLLDALAAYVNLAIPTALPPHYDTALAAQGQAVFNRADVGCATCHSGPALTDSGAGNPNLDFGGPIVLHDVGTCVQSGAFPDVAHLAEDGNARAACQFDTPALRGMVDSAPYLHDGSAATLNDVLAGSATHGGGAAHLSAGDTAALLEYLKSL